MKIIAVCTSKGGAGKTTTCVNLSYAISLHRKKILLIDCDKQGNLANYFNINSEKTLASFLISPESGIDIVSVRDNISLINSGKQQLARTEKMLMGERSPMFAMSKYFIRLRESDYDYIFLDLGPSLSLINENALYFCDEVLIPCSIGMFDLTGITQLISTVEDINENERHNNTIQINGILINMFDMRTKLSEQIENTVRENFSDVVYKTRIRKNIAISEAPTQYQSVQEYAPNSHGAVDFKNFGREFLNHG